MEPKPLATVVKQSVQIKLGDAKVDFHSGCSIIDVNFSNVFYVEIQEIHFKNYYVASLSLLAKQKDTSEGGEPRWKVAVKGLQLMPNPHCDVGSEDYFTIPQKQFLFPLQNILGLRFVLRQPSPIWKESKIEDIKIYKSPYQAASNMVLPSWLSEATVKDDDEQAEHEKQLKGRGVPSVNVLSRDMQSMWALVEEMRSNQTQNSLGRYDVDGSYEINLLSYS